MMRELEGMTFEEQLGLLCLFGLEERILRSHLIGVYNYNMKGSILFSLILAEIKLSVFSLYNRSVYFKQVIFRYNSNINKMHLRYIKRSTKSLALNLNIYKSLHFKKVTFSFFGHIKCTFSLSF